jgi:hypothetical protein
MKHLILALSFLTLTLSAYTQQPNIVREEWDAAPGLDHIDERYSKESALILLDKRRIEYVDIGNDKIAEYRTVHRIIRVNDDKGIESFNKVYLGYTDTTDIIDVKARAILPNGAVREVNRRDMKDFKNDDGRMYKIFAMEGLEKGSEVEFYYTTKRNTNFFGEETLQGAFPTLDATLEIFCPNHLVFQLKGDNCTPQITDTVVDRTRILFTKLTDIPGVEKEKYSAYEANLRQIEYRLSYNNVNDGQHIRLNTWNAMAQRIHEIYETFTEKELNRVGEFIGDKGWQKLPDDQQKIMAVENYVKRQFTTREDIDNQNADNIEWMIKNKLASHHGIIRLYAAIFQKLGVEQQIVLTCNRMERHIDKSFENWDDANQFLFFFPSTRKFLAPTLVYVRYPWIEPQWASTNAVFCQTTTIGNFTTAIAVIKLVPLEDISESISRDEATLRFNTQLDSLQIDLKETLTGYLALGSREAFMLRNPEDRRILMKEVARSTTNSEKILSSSVENDSLENDNNNKPFVIQMKVLSDGLLENAGKNILVKIGQILGNQTEMYQEKPRQFPVDIPYAHTLERSIDFIIPPGYMIKNPNDLVIHQDFKTNGEPAFGFSSDYKMDGDSLHIHILEQYYKTSYPLSEYDNFVKVINAAADFNKVTLVLMPK